jgi:hypothetical protein
MLRLSCYLSAWAICALIGFWALLNYELTPGESALTEKQWPAETSVALDRDKPTLVVFFHPLCPCSKASMGELEKLATDCPDRFALQIVFVVPPEIHESWEQSRLVTAAGRLPEARVRLDYRGVEAARFHASTSGETRLYSQEGRLLFQGGITASRGHEGGNQNLECLRASIAGRSDAFHAAPVYGCPLLN